jgi:hypothetical protein
MLLRGNAIVTTFKTTTNCLRIENAKKIRRRRKKERKKKRTQQERPRLEGNERQNTITTFVNLQAGIEKGSEIFF